jgi:hypothetical protein
MSLNKYLAANWRCFSIFLRNTNLDPRNYYTPRELFTTRISLEELSGGQFFTIGCSSLRIIREPARPLVRVLGLSLFHQRPAGRDLSDVSDQVTGTFIGPAVANTLSQKLGYPVSVGGPFYFSGCTAATCVFPCAIIPKSVWSAPAASLFQFIPMPNIAASSNFPT